MDLKTHSQNVHSARYKLTSTDDRLRLGVFSDIHFDSKHCHREMFKKHLEECDYAIIIGDLFDVMGTYRDPRSKPQEIRPEYYEKGKSYLDAIVQDCYEFLKPYRKKLLLIGYGNHETNIIKRHDTNIIDRLCFLLRLNNKECTVKTGGYSGFIDLIFSYRQATNKNRSVLLYYHHGAGGNAMRSKDVLRSQIDSFKVPQADIIVSGHTHNKIHDPSNVRMHLKKNYEIEFKSMDWIKTGSYKRDDVTPGVGGWEVEKDFLPTKMGGWFIDFNYKFSHKDSWIERTVVEAR